MRASLAVVLLGYAWNLCRLSHDNDAMLPMLPEADDDSPVETVRPPSLDEMMGTGFMVETYKSTQRDPGDSITQHSEEVFASLLKIYVKKGNPATMAATSLFRGKRRADAAMIFYQLLGTRRIASLNLPVALKHSLSFHSSCVKQQMSGTAGKCVR